MKQTNGLLVNISDEVIGIVTHKPRLMNKSRYVLVGEYEKGLSGYAATVSYSSSGRGTCPLAYSIPTDCVFYDGDVVLITKDGTISVLYEINSYHNSIMATERCNHRCIMCPQPPVMQEKDRTDFNLKLISLFDKSTKEVGITGGEPTLVGDNLFVLIRHIQKHLPHAAISILSNGVKFADKEYAKKLALCNHHDLQIDIPIFSDIASEHNRIVGAKTFYKTVQGLYNLALFHQRIGIRVVVHKQTYKRLPQLADYIYHNFPFVSQVAFMQMETVGLADKNFDSLWIDPYDYREEQREAVLLLRDRGIPSYIYNSQLCIIPKDIREYAVQSISDWKDIYLDECKDCALQGKCAGFFESNRLHHSQHIKPELSFTPQPEPIGENDSLSSFVLSALDKLSGESLSALDVPCGYGRYTVWLSEHGFNVKGIDIDNKALQYIKEKIITNGLENITIEQKDILSIKETDVCDVLINIHLYHNDYLPVFSRLVRKGGLLIVETPENRAGNFVELPYPGEVNAILSQCFEILDYYESKPNNGRVSVKVIARKK